MPSAKPPQQRQASGRLLTRSIWPTRHLDEAIVEGKIVPKRILPALRVLAVEWKSMHDEFVDLGERQLKARISGKYSNQQLTIFSSESSIAMYVSQMYEYGGFCKFRRRSNVAVVFARLTFSSYASFMGLGIFV